jgi:hypothetical protein
MITLSTLANATEREVFEQVKAHLLKQKERSKDRSGDRCLYRGINGLKCAAGCLIADSEYQPFMELSWLDLVGEEFVPEAYSEFISSLQELHDNIDPSMWEQELNRIEQTRLTLRFNNAD